MNMIERKISAIGQRTAICFAAVFPNGARYQNRVGTPAFTLVFRSPAAEWRIAAMGHVGLLESYFRGSLDIEGDLALAFRAGYDGGFDMRFKPLVRLRNWWHELRLSNRTREQAKANARFHYGIGTEFYRLWLD
ncbi:MAG: SAM-dependent methyltransferase, partial [Burkholderiales bacterium]